MGNQRNKLRIVRLLTGGFLIASCFLSSHVRAKQLDDRRSLFRFDAGPHDSLVLDNSIPLYPDSDYTRTTGFGWTRGPAGGFDRADLLRSRSALTIDGVTGKRLAWRANVAPGEWNITIWLESAPSGTPPIRVLIQGQQLPLGWQKFTAPTEPSRWPPKIFRVFHSVVQVGAKGVSIELTGEKHEVRLLGMSLMRRQDDEVTPAHQAFLARLAAAGRHDSHAPLSKLMRHAEK